LEELILLQIDCKNNYSLSLILDIVENICTKKVFIKLNLWYSYNNVVIKGVDEWKIAFIMLERLFEPMIIFSRLKTHQPLFKP